MASFHAPEDGYDWQLPGPSGVTPPDDIEPPVLPDFLRVDPARSTCAWPRRPSPAGSRSPTRSGSARRAPLGDDPALHACVMTFLSDMGVVGSARAPGSRWTAFSGASLDHAVWFHRPARADEWLLFSVDPVTNYGARGLARGTLHTEAGVLVASIAQEALLRPAGEQRMA